tara:strand:+ start:725 stop:1123 length:399 start_codon:yes stop_codon:yes gene_type:complete
MKNQTKLSQLKTKRTELHKYIKDLDHQIYTELRLTNERWTGYRILKESSYESENKEWNGEEDNECRKITGDCYEIWQCVANDNAEYMQKSAIEHAKKVVTAQTKKEGAERELEQNWKDICKEEKEEAKKEVK